MISSAKSCGFEPISFCIPLNEYSSLYVSSLALFVCFAFLLEYGFHHLKLISQYFLSTVQNHFVPYNILKHIKRPPKAGGPFMYQYPKTPSTDSSLSIHVWTGITLYSFLVSLITTSLMPEFITILLHIEQQQLLATSSFVSLSIPTR